MRNTFKMSTISAAIMLSIAGSAVAQNTSSNDEEKQLEIIEITAQKRAQSINDVPMAISAVNADMLVEKGIDDVADMSAVVPAFVASPSQNGIPIYTLRGIGFNDGSAQATSTVGVYTDEIAVAYPSLSSGLMLDMERIEIMKGPQGTLFGRNATAGAINMITGKPEDEFSGKLKGGYSSYQTLDLEGVVNLPISDSVRARVALRKQQSGEGWQKSVTRDEELGEVDKTAARITIDADLSDATLARFSYNMWQDKSDAYASMAIAMPFSNVSAGTAGLRDAMTNALPDGAIAANRSNEDADWFVGIDPSMDKDSSSMSLRIEHTFDNDMQLTFLAGRTDYDEYSLMSQDGIAGFNKTEELAAFVPYETSSPTHYANALVDFNSEIESNSYEMHLQGSNELLSWITGIYLSDSEIDSTESFILDATTTSNSGIVFSQIANPATQKNETKGIFFSADWNLSEDLVLTTGVRYSEDEAKFASCTADRDGSLSAAFNGANMAGQLAIDGVLPPAFAAFASIIPTFGPGECGTTVGFSEFTTAGGNTYTGAVAGLVENELKEDSISWRTAINYELSRDVSVYGSLSRGFKAGSFPTLSAQLSEQYEPAVQEQLDALEIGIKANINSIAQVNASVFYYDYTDKQLRTRTATYFGNLALLDNADESEAKGIEVDFRWLVTDNLTLDGGATYMTTEVSGFEGFTSIGVKADFSGSPFPYSPEFSANLSANYENEINENFMFIAGLDIAHQGERYSDYQYSASDVAEGFEDLHMAREPYNSLFKLDSYTTVNGRIGLADADGEWRAFAWVRNLTDEDYATSTAIVIDTMAQYSAMPRTLGVTFEYLFE